MVNPSAVLPFYTVVEAALPVAMGVNHLLCAVFLRHIGKFASFFQNIGGGIVQKHNEFSIPIRFC